MCQAKSGVRNKWFCQCYNLKRDLSLIGDAQRPSIDAVGILEFRPPGTAAD